MGVNMKQTMEVTILGSGTSTGVPIIACPCEVCASDDPKNKRFRSSILVQDLSSSFRLVIDTSPDFRSQILSNNIKSLDAVLYSHNHADHTNGFDDLRVFYFFNKKKIQCWIAEKYYQEFKNRFSYAFNNTGYQGTTPQVELKTIPEQAFQVGPWKIESFPLPHGNIDSWAFKIGDFVYATDFKNFTEQAFQAWRGKIHTMVASGVRFTEHPSHSSVLETADLFRKLGVKKGYISHLSHEVEHQRDSSRLPKNTYFAYDGLKITV